MEQRVLASREATGYAVPAREPLAQPLRRAEERGPKNSITK